MSEEKPAEDHTKFIASMRLECAAFAASVGGLIGVLKGFSSSSYLIRFVSVVGWAVLFGVAIGLVASVVSSALITRVERDHAAAFTRFAAVVVIVGCIYALYAWAAAAGTESYQLVRHSDITIEVQK